MNTVSSPERFSSCVPNRGGVAEEHVMSSCVMSSCVMSTYDAHDRFGVGAAGNRRGDTEALKRVAGRSEKVLPCVEEITLPPPPLLRTDEHDDVDD